MVEWRLKSWVALSWVEIWAAFLQSALNDTKVLTCHTLCFRVHVKLRYRIVTYEFEYKLLSTTKFSQPANLTNYTIWSLFSIQVEPAPHSVVTLARPYVSSSLQITNRSFRYASPHLWNQLPSSFRQPHCVHSLPGSSHPTHITSSQSSPSTSPSVTPSTFHSRLKIHLFHKSFPS